MPRTMGTRLCIVGLALASACGGRGSSDIDPFVAVDDPPDAAFFNAVWAVSPDDVWVAADGGRMLHFDGSTWTPTELGPAATMVDIWGFGPTDIWAVGGNTVAHFTGADWELIDLSAAMAGISSVSTIWGTSANDLWVGGDQSTAAHFDGTTWTRHIIAGTDNVALWGSGSDDVYVGSIFDAAHWNGSEWRELDSVQSGATAIWGFGPDDVWLANDSDLAHFDGSTWEPSELDGIGGAEKLWGAAPDDIWGVGSFGVVVHYDGQRWDERQSQTIGAPYLESIVDVHGSSSTDVWAVGMRQGDGGLTPQLLHYDGG